VRARISPNGLKLHPQLSNFSGAQSPVNQAGEFTLRNLQAGQYDLNSTFFAKYWYLRSIKRPAPNTRMRDTDLAHDGVTLKFGDQVSGVTVTLAEGAASLKGKIKLSEGDSIPAKLYVHIVPAEKESADDVLRFFTAPVMLDGTFALNNVPPGKYLLIALLSPDNEVQTDARLRAADAVSQRVSLRRAAETAKTEIEFKPCQNISDYQLPFAISTPKN
jgi:hypothetical protein